MNEDNELYRCFEAERVKIGEGVMSKVYLWRGFAYKCFSREYPDYMIAYETQVQKKIFATGLPVAKYYKSPIPRCIKMDYIDGITLSDRIRREKYKNGLADLTELFPMIHNVKNIDVPRLSPYISGEISKYDCAPEMKAAAIKIMGEIPEEDALCHLDYHFLNLMYCDNADYRGYKIIDWVSATLGNPIYDYARSYVIMFEFANRMSGKFLNIVKAQCGFDADMIERVIYVMTLHRLTQYGNNYKNDKISALANELYSRIK